MGGVDSLEVGRLLAVEGRLLLLLLLLPLLHEISYTFQYGQACMVLRFKFQGG